VTILLLQVFRTQCVIANNPGHQTPKFLTLAENGTSTLGQEVFTIGFPVTNILGDKPKYSEGTISALSGLNNDDSWIQVSTPIQPGNSGGPLVNESGQVVGIVTATAAVEKFFAVTGSLPQNINWAIKADYARALIPEASTNTRLSNKQEVIAHTEKSICRVIAR
jgi:S1-C subfamily serine protease